MTGAAPDLDVLLALLDDPARLADDRTALRLGDAGRWLVDALTARGMRVLTTTGVWASVQLDRRYPVVLAHPAGDAAAALAHCAVQHLHPGGLVVFCGEGDQGDADELVHRFDLEPVIRFDGEGRRCSVHRRTERFTIHDLVFEARSTIGRVDARQLAAALDTPSPPLVVDTRTHTDRQRYGVIDGSIHAPRTVVEWHLDPSNGYRHPAIESLDQQIVVVCNGGYSSSLAAANLARLGFTDVVDLVGGMNAWIAAGFPTVEPDHSHLDL